MQPTTTEETLTTTAVAPQLRELAGILLRLRQEHPRILGYLTADFEGELGLCDIPDFREPDHALPEGQERSLRIYLLAQGGLLALCLSGLDPLPGVERALSTHLMEVTPEG